MGYTILAGILITTVGLLSICAFVQALQEGRLSKRDAIASIGSWLALLVGLAWLIFAFLNETPPR